MVESYFILLLRINYHFEFQLLKGFSESPENVVMHHLPTFTWMNAVRIHPHTWNKGICLRVEFYGMDSSGEVLISKVN